jgi:hypothetical protein
MPSKQSNRLPGEWDEGVGSSYHIDLRIRPYACPIAELETSLSVERLRGVWCLTLFDERRVAGGRNGRDVAENAFALV